MCETRKRLVSEWGLPTADDLPVMVEHDSGAVESYCYAGVPRNIRSWWPLTIPTEYEPPPERVPDGWRPMSELPDRHEDEVWVARSDGRVSTLALSQRGHDDEYGRLWWRPIEPPAHPGVGR